MKKYLLFVIFLISCNLQESIDESTGVIKLYQGTTTVPPMAFFGDLVTSDVTIPKILHTARFLSEGVNFDKYNITKTDSTEDVFRIVEEFLIKYPNKNFEIHTQLFLRCFDYGRLLKMIPKDRIESINLYDDGSLDYTGSLYPYKENNDAENKVSADELQWELFFKGESDIPGSLRYSLEKFYPGRVVQHMLRPDYLELHVGLIPIKKRILSNKKIDFYEMGRQFSSEQKKLYNDLVGFNEKTVREMYESSPNHQFVLTGTTTWQSINTDRDFYAQEQINIIKNLIDPSGDLYKYLEAKNYDFFFKLHPRGNDINDTITAAFPDYIRIPDSVGYEVLIVAGLVPEKTGGVLSSLYFTLPKDKISFLVTTGNRAAAMNSSLVKVMLELEIMDVDQLYFWDDLKDMP